MAEPVLSLFTPQNVLKGLQAEIARAGKDVARVGSVALRGALDKGEQDAEAIAKARWANIDKIIERYTYSYKFNRKAVTGRVAMSGRKVELHRFMTTAQLKKQQSLGLNRGSGQSRSSGVTATVYKSKGPQTFPGTFVQQMTSGKYLVFKRTGRPRYPIKVFQVKEDLNTPFIEKLSAFEKKAADTFEAELNKALDAEAK